MRENLNQKIKEEKKEKKFDAQNSRGPIIIFSFFYFTNTRKKK